MTAPNHDRLHKAVVAARFPCELDDLVRQAAAAGADDDTLGHLVALPHRIYHDADSVEAACTELHPD